MTTTYLDKDVAALARCIKAVSSHRDKVSPNPDATPRLTPFVADANGIHVAVAYCATAIAGLGDLDAFINAHDGDTRSITAYPLAGGVPLNVAYGTNTFASIAPTRVATHERDNLVEYQVGTIAGTIALGLKGSKKSCTLEIMDKLHDSPALAIHDLCGDDAVQVAIPRHNYPAMRLSSEAVAAAAAFCGGAYSGHYAMTVGRIASSSRSVAVFRSIGNVSKRGPQRWMIFTGMY